MAMIVKKDQFIRRFTTERMDLAEKITDCYFRNHPEGGKRSGETGRDRCRETSISHLSYLFEAMQVDSQELFNYCLEWEYNMMEARDIPTDDLLRNLHSVTEVISAEFSVDEASETVPYLERGTQHLMNLKPDEKTFLIPENPLAEEAKQYLNHLLKGRRNQAARLINQLVEKGVTVPDIYEQIFQATQYELGALWQKKLITVAHEHYCTAATQVLMARLYPVIFSRQKNGLKLIACSVGNELHEIGIRMVSDYFEMDGWDTCYLGSHISEAHILNALHEENANLLAISATGPVQVSRVKSIIRTIRDNPDFRDLKIMVGGYLFTAIPGLAEKVGADATALNARMAILKANTLMN